MPFSSIGVVSAHEDGSTVAELLIPYSTFVSLIPTPAAPGSPSLPSLPINLPTFSHDSFVLEILPFATSFTKQVAVKVRPVDTTLLYTGSPMLIYSISPLKDHPGLSTFLFVNRELRFSKAFCFASVYADV